jgi:hypothetical protein
LWQVLKVEESLIMKILLQLDPVDLMNLEASCVLLRDCIDQNRVWKYKLLNDFSYLLTSNVMKDKLDLVVTEANEKHNGDVVNNDNWCDKLKYVHSWNLKINWNKGQFFKSEVTMPIQGWIRNILSTDFFVIGKDPAQLFSHKKQNGK